MSLCVAFPFSRLNHKLLTNTNGIIGQILRTSDVTEMTTGAAAVTATAPMATETYLLVINNI